LGFFYNVQHDCLYAKCTASGKQPLIQERVELGLFKFIIEHKPIERFVINTHAFHNAHRLRAVLEHSLVAPIPIYPPRVQKAKHAEFACSLWATQKAKLAVRAAKKKKEAIAPADKTGSVVPKKRTRSEMEADVNVNDRAAQV